MPRPIWTKTSQGMAAIAERDARIRALMRLGAWSQLYVPALQAKELALALQDHGEALGEAARNQVRIAVRHLVRAAYLLDWYGDLGNKTDVDSAYRVFTSAVGEIGAAYNVPAAP